jgi:hypothetical protein
MRPMVRGFGLALLPAVAFAGAPAPAPPGPDAPPDSVCIKWVSWKMPPQDPSNLPGESLKHAGRRCTRSPLRVRLKRWPHVFLSCQAR